MLEKHFDKLLVIGVLLTFLLLHLFVPSPFSEHSADLALGCLLGLVKGQKETQ